MEPEIDGLVRQFLQAHPNFKYPPSGDTHPSILAMTLEMQPWLIKRLGGYEPYWEAMLKAAKV